MDWQVNPKDRRESFDDAPIVVQVPRSALAMVVAIIEGYEHLAVCRVVEPKKATMEIFPSPHLREEVRALLDHLERELAVRIEIVSR